MADSWNLGMGDPNQKSTDVCPPILGNVFFWVKNSRRSEKSLPSNQMWVLFFGNRFGCLFGGLYDYLLLRYIKCQSKSKRVKSGICLGGIGLPDWCFCSKIVYFSPKISGKMNPFSWHFFFKMGGSTINQIRNMEPLWECSTNEAHWMIGNSKEREPS